MYSGVKVERGVGDVDHIGVGGCSVWLLVSTVSRGIRWFDYGVGYLTEEFVIINVYAPCEFEAKKELWDQLSTVVLSSVNLCLCVCGDFNSVRSVDERKGRGGFFRQREADVFNNFIHDNLLIDLPICGRLFTWYKGDGVSMSRINRFLLSNKWCKKWPNCIQVAYQRGLSDHVPLLLHVDDVNWGLRPPWMLKCWSDYPGYANFLREKWGSFDCHGWGGFVLQKKLKK